MKYWLYIEPLRLDKQKVIIMSDISYAQRNITCIFERIDVFKQQDTFSIYFILTFVKWRDRIINVYKPWMAVFIIQSYVHQVILGTGHNV